MSEDNPLFRTVQQQMSQDARIQTLESVESTFDMRTASAFLQLPGLRGFWPMSAFGATGQAFDQSGNVRTLTYNGNPTYNQDNLVPYIDLDGAGDYLSRADEASLDILGTETYVAAPARGLTMGGWFYFDLAIAPAGDEHIFAKQQRGVGGSYVLVRAAGTAPVIFAINGGGGGAQVTSTNSTAIGWFFIVGRFAPSTTTDIYVQGIKTSAATAVAALNNTAFNLTIGADSVGASELDGRVSMCFLCVQALDDIIIRSLFNQTRQLFQV